MSKVFYWAKVTNQYTVGVTGEGEKHGGGNSNGSSSNDSASPLIYYASSSHEMKGKRRAVEHVWGRHAKGLEKPNFRVNHDFRGLRLPVIVV